MSWGGAPQQLTRAWSVGVAPSTAHARLTSAVADQGGRLIDEPDSWLTARFGSMWAWRLFGPVYNVGRRRCPATVTLAATPFEAGCRIAAQAEIGVSNFFHAKITEKLYDERLPRLLDALEQASARTPD